MASVSFVAGTLTIVGDGGVDDTIIINATDEDSAASVTINGFPAGPFDGITAVNVSGLSGNDRLIINNPAGGLFAPTGGISYNGGGQGGDALESLGGTATAGTYTPGPTNDAGTLTHTSGALAQIITFTGLAPITDTVAEATFTINGNDAANFIDLDNGTATGDGLLFVRIDAFEPIEFANKTNVVINGGQTAADQGDFINLNFSEASNGLSSVTVNGGNGADTFRVLATAATSNVNGEQDSDSVLFFGTATLSGGTADGGAGVDTIDYFNYTTAVAVNLGANVPTLAATLQPDQEVPPNATASSGTATITYNNVAHTFDINVVVSGINPATVTGFHIHRAAVGTNGPIIVDFSAGSLVPVPGGFTFTATNVPIDPLHEAALLGGITYINVHTPTDPAGEIRGQIFANAVFVAAGGTATGTGGISNFENVVGSPGTSFTFGDSLVGDLGANALSGEAGNDVLVGVRGNDTIHGGADNDILVWSNGDGTDVMEGASGADLVQVNGNPSGADDFFVNSGLGGRIAFARVGAGAFGLDIGTTETLSVIGIGGNDTFTANNLAGIVDLSTLNLNGFDGNDTFNVRPSANTTININGHQPRAPASPGDILNFDAAGDLITVGANSLQTPGEQPVNHTNIETINTLNVGPAPPDGDFNGDGTGDLFLFMNDGSNAIWLMDENVRLGSGTNLPNVGPTWHAKALADLDPTGGLSDIVWQNDNGLVAVWQMNGVIKIGEADLLNPGTATHVKDAKDFDGNGGGDILLQNDNGSLTIWMMQDATHILPDGQITIDQNPGAPWHAIAGDFNGDGRAGILFTTDAGHTAIWEDFVASSPGHGRFNLQANLQNNGPTWHVKATADFDGDKKDDIVWQNDNGLVAVWLMDGTNIRAGYNIAGTVANGPTWHVVEARDMNADGGADILWQNDNGAVAIWENFTPGVGSSASFTQQLNVVPPVNPSGHPDWHVL